MNNEQPARSAPEAKPKGPIPPAPSPDLLEAARAFYESVYPANDPEYHGYTKLMVRAEVREAACRLKAALASTPPPEAAPAASDQDVTRLVKAAAAAMEDIEIGDLMQWPKGMTLIDALRPFAPASPAPKEADHG